MSDKIVFGAKERFLQLVSTAVPWDPDESEEVKSARAKRRKGESQSEDSGPRGADLVFPIIGGCRLYVDDTGAAYVWIADKLQPLDAKNRELNECITYQCRETTGKFPSKEAVNTAISYYCEKARRDGEALELFNRLGEKKELFYYDLLNGRSVEIRPKSWRIIDSPVMFRRWSHQLAQPLPKKNGDPWRFFEFCRLPEDLQLLALVTICTCFIPRINHPAIHWTGPQGSGKSTASKLLKLLVDPSAVVLSSMPRKPEDLDLCLFRYHVLALDNLSGISADVADRLCSFITGGAIEKRTLHTDLETTVLKSNAIITFSSITSLTDRPDFHERTIKLTLEALEKKGRRGDKGLLKRFNEAVPDILGGVFTLISKAMTIVADVENHMEDIGAVCRMSDFSVWGYAIAEVLGGRGNEFLKDYMGNAMLATLELLEHNTFFSSIVQAMDKPGPGGLSGTFGEVLNELVEIVAPKGEGLKALEKDRSFPPSARSFRKHLERLKIPLEMQGITYQIDNNRTNKGKASVQFLKIDMQPDQQAPALDDLVFDDEEIKNVD
jgi:hypothetical protein